MGNIKAGNIETVERQRQALELRKAGMSYVGIAAQLGYANHSGALKAVRSALKAVIREPAQELIDLESARLDDMLAGIWLDARKGNVLKIDRALKIMARRADLLGLDAPKKHEDVTDYRERAARIAAEIGKPELAGDIERDMVLRHEALRGAGA